MWEDMYLYWAWRGEGEPFCDPPTIKISLFSFNRAINHYEVSGIFEYAPVKVMFGNIPYVTLNA